MPAHHAFVRVALLAVVLAVLAAVVPVPFVELMPGPVTNTLGRTGRGTPVIAISGHPTYPTTGRLDLTTVAVEGGPPGPITLAQAVRAWVDPTNAVLPQSLLYPPGQSPSQVNQVNTAEMSSSQEHAIVAALRSLGYPVPTQVVVAAVLPGKPAAGRLRPGDVITAVDGHAVTDLGPLVARIGGRRPGQPVRLTIVRAGRSLVVSVPTVADPQNPARAFIGIETAERHRFPFQVSINLKDVGGPSAGLMFTLGIIDKLTPGNLAAGRTIAGTGTISDDGQVGPIGGIQQKIPGARAAGATVFLTPAANCAAAKSVAPPGLRLVRVRSLADALHALALLDAGKMPPGC